MIDKNSHILPPKASKTKDLTVLMRPYLTVILKTLDLMREGVFDDLDQERKTQLINNAFSSAQKLSMTTNKLITMKPRTGRDNLTRFYITLLKEGVRPIPPQS